MPSRSANELYKDMTPEFKAADPIYKSPDTFEAAIRRFVKIEFAKALAIAVIGVLSGILLIARRRAGRVLAICVCSLLFLLWVNAIMHFAVRVSFSTRIVEMLFLPGWIREHIVNPIFFAFTVFFLTRKSVGRQFRNAVVPTPLPSAPSGS
jgi:hypothetical protein